MMTLDDHEMRLAICLARRGMADMPGGTVDSHDAPDIDGNINWSLFEEKVARHRLVPLVSRGMDN